MLGTGLLNVYGRTASACITGVYPEHKWEMWRFDVAPLGWWREPNNQRQFIQHLAKKLNIKEPSDWYSITMEQIDANGGTVLLQLSKRAHSNLSPLPGSALRLIYNHSPSAIVTSLVPTHKFLPWKFSSVRKNFWDDRSCRQEYMEWLRQTLGYYALEDLYKLNIASVSGHGGMECLCPIPSRYPNSSL